MLGDTKTDTKPLVTPEEILSLEGKIIADTYYLCREIGEKAKKHIDKKYGFGDYEWRENICYSILFEAGRMQGKREERMKRKGMRA